MRRNFTLLAAIYAAMGSSLTIENRPALSEGFKTHGGGGPPSKRRDRTVSRKNRNKRLRMQKLSRRINFRNQK